MTVLNHDDNDDNNHSFNDKCRIREIPLFCCILGSYIYIETSWPRVQGEMARIISPQVNGIKCVTFYYHMKGETVCELNVYIDDGTDRKMFWTQKGEASQVWEKAVIPVRGYSSFKASTTYAI